MRTATKASVPVIGSTLIQTTTDLLATLKRVNGALVQTHQTCSVHPVASRALVQTILPDAFIRALGSKTYPVTLTEQDGYWRFDADLGPQHIGFHGNLSGGAMPRNKHHPAIYDWDGDGKPGASVWLDVPIIGHVRIYMVQLAHSRLSGWVESVDRVSGEAEMMQIDQKTIGADNRLFAGSPSIAVGEGHKAFEMERLPEGSTCAEVIER